MQKVEEILNSAISSRSLKRLVLSRSRDKTIKKTTGTLFERAGVLNLQFETLMLDGKAVHRNIIASEAAAEAVKLLKAGYRQADIITAAGSCQVMVSAKGKVHISGSIGEPIKTDIGSHDREKSRFLDGSEPFLTALNISDAKGRVYDKKRAKFRQINRFVELLDDVYNSLPEDKTITAYDLCCGKGYLTFAVYHYLTEIRGRDVIMHGVDLKQEIMLLCEATARSVEYGGLTFQTGDISDFVPPFTPDLAISLHACDTATDYALASAVRQGAGVILSTPCCHHEMMASIDAPELDFIMRYPILKQKLCDAATDSLRALLLEIAGYQVDAVELVDPDETPKNIMLRAVKRGISGVQKNKLLQKYEAAVKLLGAQPLLGQLLNSDSDNQPNN